LPAATLAACRCEYPSCTHTRYIHEGILNYAEDLLGTFGGKIKHVMFT
jgi:hypothetical protein